MQTERQSQPTPQKLSIQNQPSVQESSFLFEKLREAVEHMTEHVADQFTYSGYLEFRGNKNISHNDRCIIEGLIHQIRDVIRRDFKTTFESLCEKHAVKQALMNATIEIERMKIIHELGEVSAGLFKQGKDYYFEFMLNVLERIKETNRSVNYLLTQINDLDNSQKNLLG